MRIAESLLRTADTQAQNVALLYRDQRLSYADLLRNTLQYASVLQRQNVQPGDVVAICFENSPEFICSYYAISWLGAAVLPVNVLLTPREIAYLLRDCQARGVVTRQEFWPKFSAALADGNPGIRFALLAGGSASREGSIEVTGLEEQLALSPPLESGPAPVPEDSVAVLIYTSGTTGTPKGVMLSHRNLMSNAHAVARATSALEGDTFFLLLPVFHITSQTVCMLTPILIGASVAIVSRMDRAEMAHAFREFRPTVFVAVPSIYNMMAGAPPPEQNPVRLYVSGGAPLPAEVQNRFEAAYRKPIFSGYGLTEASPVVSWNIPGASKPGSVGRPLQGVSVKIVGIGTEALAPREIGEICVAGDLVMLGYYDRPAETAETIVNGWLRTGDMGYVDEEGYLYVVDRKKEMLICSGINIYPREVEELLHTIPEILEAAVVGVPDSARGELPVAFVTTKEASTATEKTLKDSCAAALARYKVPRRIFIIDQFPRTGSGKINKLQLKEEAQMRMEKAAASRNRG